MNSRRIASRSASVKPVVPTTACRPCSAAKARLPRAASATVKSTTTSAPASTSASDAAATWRWVSTLATRRRSMPACSGSTAATSSRSGSASTASHTVLPMRPAAPKTPTLVIGSASSGGRRRRHRVARRRAAAAAGRGRRGGRGGRLGGRAAPAGRRRGRDRRSAAARAAAGSVARPGGGGGGGRRLLLLGAELAVLGLVGGQLAEHAGDVLVGLVEAALVLGVGPRAELAEQAVGLALGLLVGDAVLGRLGDLADLGCRLVEEAHVPSPPCSARGSRRTVDRH